jgi:hypothetical protein
MFNSKPLNILYNAVTYSNSISSTMNDPQVYEYLCTYHFPLIKASHITIRKPFGKLAQLSYDTLKAGTVYTIATSAERVQGAVPTSAASQRTAQNLAVICAHWGLQYARDIFPLVRGVWEGVSVVPRTRNEENKLPSTMSDFDTPLSEPKLWGRRFTEQPRVRSLRTKGRHEVALRLAVGRSRWESRWNI